NVTGVQTCALPIYQRAGAGPAGAAGGAGPARGPQRRGGLGRPADRGRRGGEAGCPDLVSAQRLDVALAAAGLARSRTHARRTIEQGRARRAARSLTRPSAPVPAGSSLSVVDLPDGVEFASRAAHKLISALDTLGIDPSGLRCVDAGASTGGFSDVLLRRGAAHISAVDI